jgi:TolB-like protein
MSFIEELKRRQVLRTAAAYVAVAWLLIQVVETTFPAFGFGDEAVRLVIIVAVLGFIPVVVVSWVFQLTPEGLRRDSGSSAPDAGTGRRIDRAIIIVLAAGITFFAFDKFVLDPLRDAELAAQARSEALIESYGDKSIAVLAFADLSPDRDNEFFSDGIAEEMINLLARIPELRVISRSSAFSFKGREFSIADVAEELNVSHVLEGSVRKAGDKIRVTAQLIDARSDTHLYSANFDRTVGDIFAIQDEIAQKVVEGLKVHLTGDMPHARPTDPEAHALLLRARYLRRQMNTDNFERIEELLLQALEIDPYYLDAIHVLIRLYIGASESRNRPKDEMLERIRALVARAMEIDPDNGYTIIVSSYPDGGAVGNMPVVVDALQRGLAKDASHLESIQVAAEILRVIGRIDRSSELMEHVLSRDPLCTPCLVRLAHNYLALHDYDRAEAYIRKFRQTNGGGLHTLATILFLRGDYEEAAELFVSLEEPSTPRATVWHGQALAGIGLNKPELVLEAVAALREDHFDTDPLYLAEIYALTGDFDAAFSALDHALAVNPRDQIVTHQRPLLRDLHDDPRWQAFRERSGSSEQALAQLYFDIDIIGENRTSP